MPKLSYLLEMRDMLDKVKLDRYAKEDADMIAVMDEALGQVQGIDGAALTKKLKHAIKIKQGLANQILDQVKDNISKAIDSTSAAWQDHNAGWCSHVNRMTNQEHASFMQEMYGRDADFEEYVRNRIRFHASWQDAALLWNMGDYDNLDMFFAFYPIFIADKRMDDNRSIIEKAMTQPQMRKIRTYDQDLALEFLPKSCFRIIVAKNHFTHCNIETLDKQLAYLVKLLRSGGLICFNFNDCHEVACAKNFEMKIRSFMLGTQVRQILSKYGLEVSHWEHLPMAGTTWVEAQIPGEHRSIKLSETMGVITKKSTS